MKNKVSIIVPIYNAQKYLKACLESLLNQTYTNLEIILLNDGSTDESEKIIKKFKDNRIKYIKKENTGIGDTRNQGIDLATGDYLMFVDADDYLELNAIEELLNKALTDHCDLVLSDHYLKTAHNTYVISHSQFKDTTLKDKEELLLDFPFAPWAKLYHNCLFQNKDNRFVVGLKFEDTPVMITSFCLAKKIGYINIPLYNYMIRKEGQTITRDAKVLDILKISKLIENILNKYHYQNKTNLMVKILMPYLKNSRYIKDAKLRNKLIKEIYNYLKSIDPNWRKCSYLKQESKAKGFILKHKVVLNVASNFYATFKN